MDKLLFGLLAAGVAIGALFIPRIARAAANNGGLLDEITVTEKERQFGFGSSPKGIRNNNPFNIEFRSTIVWVGQVGTDGRFAVFDTAENGIRAGMINIRTKFTRDGANTVRRLINILSPSFENPTEAFISFVSQKIGKAPDEPLVFDIQIIPLSKAIITFENGEQPYPDALFRTAKSRI